MHAERTAWESAFPSIWQRRVKKEAYIQASELTDSGDRWPFRRGPKPHVCWPVSCVAVR